LSKSGIVSLVGRPSVGKSTLINNLVKQKVSIVTPRAQTTRRPIRAILNTEDGSQIVFVDLPGAKKPYDALGEYLLDSVWRNVGDSDLALFVVDGSSVPPGPRRHFRSAKSDDENRCSRVAGYEQIRFNLR